MMTRTQIIAMVAAVVMASPLAKSQYSDTDNSRGNSFGPESRTYSQPQPDSYLPTRGYAAPSYADPLYNNDDRSTGSYQYPDSSYTNRGLHQVDYAPLRDEFRSRSSWPVPQVLGDYDRLPSRLNNAVEDSFRAPISSDYGFDSGRYNSNSSRGGYSNDRYDISSRERLVDPFRMPSLDERVRPYRTAPLTQDYAPDNRGMERRYRMPPDSADYLNDNRLQDRMNYRAPLDDFRVPMNRPVDQRPSELDPFTPTLPPRNSNSEAEEIFKAISARYANPVNVRSVQAMSSSQALQLYKEVSQQTDQRHLDPSTYDVRIRRGLRNLSMALDNPAFTQAMRISGDSFTTESFRNTISRMADSMRVSGYSDAQRVVQSVMQEAQKVPGLTPTVVAFEFANATIDTLDKFSALEPAEPRRGASLDLQQAERVRSAGLESEIVGVGLELKVHDAGLLVMKVLRGGPASEAGLQSGDVITGIDGRSLNGMPMASSIDLMKGSAGSRVRLQVTRGSSRSAEVTLVRRTVRIYTVNETRIVPGTDKVAYLNLSQFGQTSTQELDQALQQLYSSGMKSLIIDLRGNPGGLLNVCVDITNRFLPCGTIVSTKGRLPADNMIETATFDRTWSTPLVVLIDGDSASASEIFAAAVQDNQRGIVVGEKSYGKGTVQTHFPLQSISGNLRLTTARFYSPSGRPMAGEGVIPDIRIDDVDGPANGDIVLEEALQIAQSQRLKDIAEAAKSCKPSATPLIRNSFRQNMYDAPRIVM